MVDLIDKIEEESLFYKWLKKVFLDKYYRSLFENGIIEICYLEDVKEDDVEMFGLIKFEYRRLVCLYVDFKVQVELQCFCGKLVISKVVFKILSFLIVLSLLKVMKDFV